MKLIEVNRDGGISRKNPEVIDDIPEGSWRIPEVPGNFPEVP